MPNESIYIAGPSVRNDPRVQTPILPLAGRRFNALSAHLSPAEIESAIRLVDQPVSDRMRGAIGEEERTLADSGPTFTVTNLHTEVVPYRTPFAASLAARSRARSPASTLAIE